MKTLIIIWILAGITVLGCLFYINSTITTMAQKIKPDTFSVLQTSDLHVTNEPDNIPISEATDIQPALGYKVLLLQVAQ